MSVVFVSYRRGDAEGQARALYNELAEVLGRAAVFMDVDSIALGRDFRAALQEHLAACDCVLALIGPDWLHARDEAGRPRLAQPHDFVRLELATALKRNIAVTPVLLRGARMPAPEELPDDIRDLAYRNAFELSHTRWDSDVAELIRRLGLHRGEPRPEAMATAATTTPSAAGGSSRVAYYVIAAMVAAAVVSALMFVRLFGPEQGVGLPAEAPPVEAPAPAPAATPPATPPVTSTVTPPTPVTDDPDRCREGFVWREAVPGDRVCVAIQTRDLVQEQNRLAGVRRSPTGGAYGPNTCLDGFVWRVVTPSDLVCVTPAERDAAATDNQLGPSRRARPPG